VILICVFFGVHIFLFVDFYYIKKTLGRHLKKYKASFVLFSVPTMVECRRWDISGHVHMKQNKPQVASFVSWWSVGDSNS
jgi:hypothetical protein